MWRRLKSSREMKRNSHSKREAEGHMTLCQVMKHGIDGKERARFYISVNHSGKNDIVFSGNSSFFYSKLMSSEGKNNPFKGAEYRFNLLLEQQSIISLVSTFETFLNNVLKDHQKSGKIYHNFSNVRRLLKSCEINVEELKGLKQDTILKRTKYIIDYLFQLRNLIVHKGGIIDEKFFSKYKSKLKEEDLGKVIRITYDDFVVMREWLSFFIQEVCRVIKGYEKVWTDYVQAVGIAIPEPRIVMRTEDPKEDYEIVLEDGMELEGTFDNPERDTSVIG
jgi:hypothetical protein